MKTVQTSEDWGNATAPGIDDIARMAETVRASFPPAFAQSAAQVILRIEELADDAILADVGFENPYELTGLYDGIPLTERSLTDPPQQPDTVWLFRRAILDEWIDRGDVTLQDLVANVVVHEFAHHFGWSDADIARIDRWWE